MVSVGAVIFLKEDNKIKYLLLYRQASDYHREAWTISRGKTEKGETEEETIIREIKEETGIEDLKFIPGFREEISWTFKGRNEYWELVTFFKTAIFYLAETKTKNIELSHEHQDFAWLEFSKARERLTFESAKGVLEKANDYLVGQGGRRGEQK